MRLVKNPAKDCQQQYELEMIEGWTRRLTGLSDAQQHAKCQKTGEVLARRDAHGNDAPRYNDPSDPPSWGESLDHDCPKRLEQKERDPERGENPRPLHVGQIAELVLARITRGRPRG